MNGPLSMYKLHPLVSFKEPVELSSMYKMRSIYASTATGVDNATPGNFPNVLEQKPDIEIQKLQRRQEEVLKQLGYLKEQMSILRQELVNKGSNAGDNNYKMANQTSADQCHTVEPTWTGEVVVHASPDAPPYSLLAVGHLWPGVVRLRVTCHIHSSINELSGQLSSTFAPLAFTRQPNLNIRLIWKKIGPDCITVISPLSHCPIRGEVNLLRYIHRTIHTACDPVAEVHLDSLLDTCHRLRHVRTQRDKQQCVRALNARLGSAEFLCGKAMSVADLAAWSVIRSLSGVELSQNMAKWQARCQSAINVDAA